MKNLAQSINILGRFCGRRDVEDLIRAHLLSGYGFEQADVMVLFGGSILSGGDVLARAMQNNVARKYVIVGGEGHTTQFLRDQVQAEYPQIETAGLPEARVFAAYLKHRWGLEPDLLECASTNCGNNITNLLSLLNEQQIPAKSIILTQDATMQLRMDAGLRKHAGEGVRIINYAAYEAHVAAEDNGLAYTGDVYGMWDMQRYISLLLGEIPRLRDDANGYGPCGKGFIAHVEIPPEVESAFSALSSAYPQLVRPANPLYASK